MEEIDLKELLKIFWAKKLQIILIILIFMGIGVIYTVGFKVPLYSAETTLILASQNNNQSNSSTITTSTATDITVNSKLVSTYSELVKSKNVIRQVITNLNLGTTISEDELKNNVTVSAVKDTEIRLLLQNALTDKVNDRLVFMKGIDTSYQYEGYYTYKLEDLDQNS